MENKPFFSIIIPVYNVEIYLDECVQSILNQTFSNYEVILVDDESKDASGSMCERYSMENKNIKVIHKNNGGPSDSRNIGLENANGDYIIFIDSDDYLTKNTFLDEAHSYIEEEDFDVIVYSYKKVYEDGTYKNMVFSSHKDILEDSIVNFCKKNFFIISAWGKIIKKSILTENDILFRKGVYSEEMEWCSHLITTCNRCLLINEPIYAYRQRSGSITQTTTIKNLNYIEENMKYCTEIYNNCPKEKKEALSSFLSLSVSMYYINLASMPKDVQKEKYERLYEWQQFLKSGNRFRERILYIFTKIFGVKFTLKLLRIIASRKDRKNGKKD